MPVGFVLPVLGIVKVPDELLYLGIVDRHPAIIEKAHADGEILGLLQIFALEELDHLAAAVFVCHHLITHSQFPFRLMERL